ncbi:MAG: AraC family transcriptional regulator ligand-binding domain-containing protein [Pseudomonadota bacterium]
MAATAKYPVAKALIAACSILKVSPQRVLRRTGLSDDFLDDANASADAETYYAIWEAVAVESGRDDVVLHFAREAAHIQIVPEIIAFSCSPNVETGLQRLARYKPLIAPVRLIIESLGDRLTVTKQSLHPEVPVPPSMAAFDMVYLVELIRVSTAQRIVPLDVTLPETTTHIDSLSDYLGCQIILADSISLSLSPEDARLPLLTESSALWDAYEPRLRQALADNVHAGTVEARVGNALIDLIASGSASIDAVSSKLRISRRTLQRELSKEGTNYSRVLDRTRANLAQTYLQRDDLSIDEVSFLLGYQDPNSFYRAFQGWTGKTPSQAKTDLNQSK